MNYLVGKLKAHATILRARWCNEAADLYRETLRPLNADAAEAAVEFALTKRELPQPIELRTWAYQRTTKPEDSTRQYGPNQYAGRGVDWAAFITGVCQGCRAESERTGTAQALDEAVDMAVTHLTRALHRKVSDEERNQIHRLVAGYQAQPVGIAPQLPGMAEAAL